MLVNLTINLTGPICGCAKQSLGWRFDKYGGKSALTINCLQCDTHLRVSDQLRAFFSLDEPYPDSGGKKLKKLKTRKGPAPEPEPDPALDEGPEDEGSNEDAQQ